MRNSAIVGLAILVFAVTAFAYSGGPPDGRTGAPGESTCADCHGNLNTGSGQIAAFGPDSYVPGDTLDISIYVSQLGQTRWGFEMTILDESDNPVGNFLIVEPTRTQLSIAGSGRHYVKHTSVGTDPGPPDTSPGWTVKWVSPSVNPGAVTFFLAGNAANGNGATSGDFIYTGDLQYDATGTDVLEPLETASSWGRVKALYRSR